MPALNAGTCHLAQLPGHSLNFFFNFILKTGEMAPWVKVLATKMSDELSLIPGTHTVGKEKNLSCDLYMSCGG